MRKIIVPIDFSEHSEYALRAAATIAKKENAEVIALHMLELSDTVLTKADSEKDMETIFYLKLAEKKFNEFLEKPYLKDVNVTPIVKHFKVFSEISAVADEHDVDLIIMGSHGTSGLSELFVGSNTEKVVRYSNVPVLVVKNDVEASTFDNVVYATDFSEASIPAFKKAISILSAGVVLHLLHVNVPGDSFKSSDEIEAKVVSFLEKADGNLDRLPSVHYISDYTVERGILNHAAKHNLDLIAVSTHGRTGISHFFEGSISEDVANHSSLPVMTFKL